MSDGGRRGRGGRGRGRGGPRFSWVCPSGHKLEEPDDDSSFICDVCKREIDDEDPALSCDTCEFDVCKRCSRNPPKAETYAKILDDMRPKSKNPNRPSRLVFSAHGDTNFDESSTSHYLRPQKPLAYNDGLYFAHVDNFAGVFAMMQAYFSGKVNGKRVSCQVTYGEEGEIDGVSFMGAREVAANLDAKDCVVVIDVTAKPSAPTINNRDLFEPRTPQPVEGEISFEKVNNNPVLIEFFLQVFGEATSIDGVPNPRALEGDTRPKLRYHLYNGCPDPQCCEDESDAYRQVVENAVFMGLYTYGGKLTIGDAERAEVGVDAPDVMETDGDYNEGEVFCWRRDIDAITKAVCLLSQAFEKGLYDDIRCHFQSKQTSTGRKHGPSAAAASASPPAASAASAPDDSATSD